MNLLKHVSLLRISLLVVSKDAISVAVEIGNKEVNLANGELVYQVVTKYRPGKFKNLCE